MLVFKRILVAVDGSENSLEACSAARRIEDGPGASIEVVQVIPRSESSQGREEATKTLEKARELASRGGRRARAMLVEADGSVVDALVRHASDKGSDLIVLGAKGTGGFKQLLLGSVSGGVVTHARVPVLVVRSLASLEGRLFGHVLAAVDGSRNSLAAVDMAARLAKSMGASLTSLHVIAIPAAAYTSGFTNTPTMEKKARKEAEKCLSEAKETAGKHSVEARSRVIEDLQSPVEGITKFASENGVDLIVMGTRGLGGFRRLLLGSVATGVVSYAHCSVLVVRGA